MTTPSLSLEKMAKEIGCTEEQVRTAATVVLRELHRIAFCDEQRTTAMLLECLFTLGNEACFHLGGILNEEHDLDDRIMEEVMMRMPADFSPYFPTVQQWSEQKTPGRKNLDEAWRGF